MKAPFFVPTKTRTLLITRFFVVPYLEISLFQNADEQSRHLRTSFWISDNFLRGCVLKIRVYLICDEGWNGFSRSGRESSESSRRSGSGAPPGDTRLKFIARGGEEVQSVSFVEIRNPDGIRRRTSASANYFCGRTAR